MTKKLFNDFIKLPDKIPAPEKLEIKKTFIYDKKEWMPIELDDFKKYTIGQLLDGGMRLMLEFEYKQEKIFIVLAQKDYESLKKKYPNATIIWLDQIFKIFSKLINKDDLTMFPTLLLAFKNFNGVKFVDFKKII